MYITIIIYLKHKHIKVCINETNNVNQYMEKLCEKLNDSNDYVLFYNALFKKIDFKFAKIVH